MLRRKLTIALCSKSSELLLLLLLLLKLVLVLVLLELPRGRHVRHTLLGALLGLWLRDALLTPDDEIVW